MGRHLDRYYSNHKKPGSNKFLLFLAALGIGGYMWHNSGEPEVTQSSLIKTPDSLSTLVEKVKPVIRVDTVYDERTVHDTVYVSSPVKLSDQYRMWLSDNDLGSPYVLNNDMISDISALVDAGDLDQVKAHKVFDWVDDFDYNNRRDKTYSDSEETYTLKGGVCGELAFLYVAAARLVGLNSDFVHVTIDYEGDSVNHACASVNLDGNSILVDPTYNMYDVKHKKFRVIDDETAAKLLEEWNSD